MNLKLIGAALVFLAIASAAVAQDPTVVEPTHYKLAFENDQVQVVDVHYGPHEKSKMHSHPGGVVVLHHRRTFEIHGREGECQGSECKARRVTLFPTVPSQS